jgi:hypothetical protein
VDNSARISALEVDPFFQGIITGDGGNISNLTLQYISDTGNTTSNTLHLTGDVSMKTDGFLGVNIEPRYELHVGGDANVTGNVYSQFFEINGSANKIYGNTLIEGNTTIQGNLVVHGSTSYLYSENVFIRDPIIGLGNNGLADTGIIIAVQNPANVVFGYDASATEFIVAHSASSVDGVSLTPDPTNPINFHVYGDLEANAITTVADMVVGGNLEVRGNTTFLQVDNLAVDDAIIKIAANNTLNTIDSGVVMQRAEANVAMVYRGDENELMFAYTTDDASGLDITPLATKQMNVHVYGALYADESINVNSNTHITQSGAVYANVYYGDGGLLSNITQTLEGITAIGNTTPHNIVFTNATEGINVTANVVAGAYYGDGQWFSNVANLVVLDEFIAANLAVTREYIRSNVEILNDNIASNLTSAKVYTNDIVASNLEEVRTYMTANVEILNDNIASNLEEVRTYMTANVEILNDNIASNLEEVRNYMTANVEILNDNIASNLTAAKVYTNDIVASNLEEVRTYMTANVEILNDNIASNLEEVRTYMTANVEILNDNIASNLTAAKVYTNDIVASNLEEVRTYMTANVEILNDNIASNLTAAKVYTNDIVASNLEEVRTYMTANVEILNDNIASNLEEVRNYMTANVEILNDNIASNLTAAKVYTNDIVASNLEEVRTYMTANVEILNDNIASNLEEVRNYMTANVEILNDNIASNLAEVRTYMTANVEILNDNIASNLEEVRTYMTANVEILNDNIASNLEEARTYMTANVEILNDNIASNLTAAKVYTNDIVASNLEEVRNYMTANVEILNDNIASNLEEVRNYMTANVEILNDNIASNLEEVRTYMTANVEILNDNIASNLEEVRTYMTANVQILNDYIALKSNILDPLFTSNITVASNVTTNELAVSTLTAGRVPYVGTDNFLVDHDHLTFTQGSPSLLSVGGDVNVSGNLFVHGSTTFLHTTNTIINDALIELANNNTSDTLDMGFIMTRPSSNVGLGFRGDEAEFMIGHTLSDPSGADIVPDTGNAMAVHVYGSMNVDANMEVGTSNLFVNTTTGQVGINTDSPYSGETLEVVGSTRITSTESGSDGGPDLTLWRDRVGADGDYLGRIFFSGKADSGSGQKNYAVIRGKIDDASLSSEDGLIEYAVQRDSTLTIVSRLTSSDLELLDGTGLTVAGDVAVNTDTLFVDVSTDRVGINTTTPEFALDVRGDANVSTMNVYTIQGLQTLAFNSDNTTTPPLQLTAGSLNDGIGAIRIDSVEPDIFLNDTNGGFSTITFANDDTSYAAFGRNSSNNFYITLRDPNYNGGDWRDTTLVANSMTGHITMGYKLGVATTKFTGSNVLEIGGTANAAAYYGDGGFLSNVTLQRVTTLGNTTTQVASLLNTHTALTTDLTSNVGVKLNQLANVVIDADLTADQRLIYNGTNWVNDFNDNNFIRVINKTGVDIAKGNTLYIVDSHNNNVANVALAKSDDPSTMPCIGVAAGRINNGSEGLAVTYGKVSGVNTLGFSKGQTVYVSNSVPGGIMASKPFDILNDVDQIQNLGIVVNENSENHGIIFVTGIGRSNDIPNANIVTQNSQLNYVYVNETNNDMLKIDPTNLLTKLQTLQQVTDTGATTTQQVDFTNTGTWSLTASGNVYVASNVTALEYYGDGTKLTGVALKTDLTDNAARIGVLEANVVDLWDNVYSNATILTGAVSNISVLQANVVDLWDNVVSNASTLATLVTDHGDNVARIEVLEANVVDLWDNVQSNAATLATLVTDHGDNVARIEVLEANVVDLWDNVQSNATTLATLVTDHGDNVARISVLEANVVDLWDNVLSNASTLATLVTDHGDNVARISVLEANVVDLWDNVLSNASTLEEAVNDILDLENTRATYLDPTFTSNITVSNVAYVSNGLVVNNTRYYAHSGSMTNPSDTLGLQFTSNVFYAKVVAQLIHGSEDVNTLVLELQGGHKTSTPTKDITIGTLNKFGDTSYPWSTSVTTSPTEVTIQAEDLNQDYDYDISVEYISSGTDAKLVAIKEGSTAVKNFAY